MWYRLSLSGRCDEQEGKVGCLFPAQTNSGRLVGGNHCFARPMRRTGDSCFAMSAGRHRFAPPTFTARRNTTLAIRQFALTSGEVTSANAASSVQDKGPPKAQSALAARFSDFQAYCFASGSAPKFAWTIVHLSPFFTKTRVDFARCGVVFPSLSWVRPT
jgi:hypothetical protein